MTSENKQIGCVVLIFVFLFSIPFIVSFIFACSTDFEYEITVAKVFQRGQSMDYMVTDTYGNSYCVDDSIWYWEFRATDQWNKLKAGEKYLVCGYGWRIGFLSMFPKIVTVEELP